MSPRYHMHIGDLTDWFAERLAALPDVVVSPAQYAKGVDGINGAHAALINDALKEWLVKRAYQLSYNQVTNAFFAAAKRLNKFTMNP